MTTTKTTKKRVVKTAVKPKFTASIKILGKVYKADGATVKEAIENLKVGKVAKGVSLLTVTKGKISKDKVLPAPQTFRLFSPSKLMRELAIKNVSLMFDGI
jgi:hypothetical protein